MESTLLLAGYPVLKAAAHTVNSLVEAGIAPNSITVFIADIMGKLRRFQDLEEDATENIAYWQDVRLLTNALTTLNEREIPGVGNLFVVGRLLPPVETRSMFGILQAQGLPTDDLDMVAESIRRGDSIVLVEVPPAQLEKALLQLNLMQPVDLVKRSTIWRQRGWRGFDPMSDPYTSDEWLRKQRAHHSTLTLTQLSPDEEHAAVRRYALRDRRSEDKR